MFIILFALALCVAFVVLIVCWAAICIKYTPSPAISLTVLSIILLSWTFEVVKKKNERNFFAYYSYITSTFLFVYICIMGIYRSSTPLHAYCFFFGVCFFFTFHFIICFCGGTEIPIRRIVLFSGLQLFFSSLNRWKTFTFHTMFGWCWDFPFHNRRMILKTNEHIAYLFSHWAKQSLILRKK